MRLGQIARKYDIAITEITSCLIEVKPELIDLNPNVKLDESTIDMILEYFEKVPFTAIEENKVEEQEEQSEITAPTESDFQVEPAEKIENIAQPDGSLEREPEAPQEKEPLQNEPEEEEILLATDPQETTPTSIATEEVVASESEKEEEEVVIDDDQANILEEEIESDQLLALIDSEEPNVDLSKITRIKAPKKELSGLKVVGKIELPKDPVKAKEDEEESDTISEREIRKRRKQQHEEEKEKRRLRAKKKKEAYEARQEKRKKDKEKAQLKAKKEAHYRQKLEQASTQQARQKAKTQKNQKRASEKDHRPQPKTLLGKFWRWLNT